MSLELAYFLKINVAIVIFYAFYRLFFYKDTFFPWRRASLLGFFIISLLYPLLNIQEWIKEQEPIVAMVDLYAQFMLPEAEISEAPAVQAFTWKSFISSSLMYLYWGVLTLLIARFLVQLFAIIRLAINSPTSFIKGTKVHLLKKAQGPFSFFGWIFIHPDMHKEELDEILIHEQTHARQWHSIDVVVSELFCIVCWFNPFVWLMKREVRSNLEFMADNKVLEQGHDCRTYQYHLLGLAHHKQVATLSNSFNVLPLKNRIKMMNKKRTKQIGRTKYLMFLPLAALLLVVSNIESVARTASHFIQGVEQDKNILYKGVVVDENNKPLVGAIITIDDFDNPIAISNEKGEFSFMEKESVVFIVYYKTEADSQMQFFKSNSEDKLRESMVLKLKSVQAAGKVVDGNTVFEVVEQMPDFPGGQGALMEFLSKNIKYPENAAKNKTQGRVIIQFVVGKDGTVTDPVVVRSVDPYLDKEALRVIGTMPKWTPGKQKGKEVAVKYTIPVAFKLTEPAAEPIDKIDEMTVIGYADRENEETPQAVSIKLPQDTTYEIVEEMPKFPGGHEVLMLFLSKNIKYPVEAQKQKIQGRVIVQFIVNKEGNLINPTVIRSVHPLLDAEALRVIDKMPKWEPGKQKGKTVNVKYTVPINFRL